MENENNKMYDEFEEPNKGQSPEIDVQLPRGYVQVQQIDEKGNPIEGTEFVTSEKIFNDVYQKRGFTIKKKAKN